MNKKITVWIIAILLSASAKSANSIQQADTLRVGLHIDAPFVFKDANGHYKGLSVDLWEGIAKDLNKPFTYVPFNDEIGMIRSLDYDQLDVSINPLANSGQRMENFEVTQPFFISSVGVAITSSSRNQFQLFVNNFFSQDFLKVILLLLMILLSFGTVLWFVERRQNKYQFRPGIKGLFDGLWWAAVTMTTVGYGDKAPKTHAGKAIAIVWMFTAVIIISSFTATIASTLTVNTLESKITRFEDLYDIEQMGVVGASEGHDFLISEGITPTKKFSSSLEGLRALARKDVDVMIHDKTILEYQVLTNQLENTIQVLPLNFLKQYRSFILSKDHPDFHRINTLLVDNLQDAQWEGVLEKYNLEE